MTSHPLVDEESEIIRHFVGDLYKYEDLLLVKKVYRFPYSLCRNELRLMPAPTESLRMIFDDFSFSRFWLTG
jgi:hypothetical protein